jgi:hypothetical protein
MGVPALPCLVRRRCTSLIPSSIPSRSVQHESNPTHISALYLIGFVQVWGMTGYYKVTRFVLGPGDSEMPVV